MIFCCLLLFVVLCCLLFVVDMLFVVQFMYRCLLFVVLLFTRLAHTSIFFVSNVLKKYFLRGFQLCSWICCEHLLVYVVSRYVGLPCT